MSRDFWDKNAEPWRQAIQSRLIESRKITNPAIIQEIVCRQPRSVLDLGCGEGWIASQLVPEGIQYTGFDFSSKLIEIAKRSYPNASFESLSYDDLIQERWKKPNLFDLVVFNFSLFDEDLRPILRKASTYMKSSGSILVQTLHPCFTLSPYVDGWKTEDFKSFPIPFDGTMPWYGRTLESWSKTFSESGLKLEKISEPLNPATQIPVSLIFALAL